ncbi:MAG: glutamine--fructose-6-phosphate transaminase (isomerizing) [Opitutae bacterium]|jgi:glutamine---fructose-6-phosphate transaminase (isomerizing)|nr:glutamine--fructose-6-phosphate transaminase (isomerizing) [Opitutae bacterium]MBT5691948.1 glutamine--fructose-6-phosphate transaminase (isomerizing) [Opitutae bacterium]
MCGIVGYIGKQKAASILLDGLQRLEYRGYDSAGLAVLSGEKFSHLRRTGRVKNLAQAAREHSLFGGTGIGHTRWATHGEVTEANTHPHVSSDEKFALVHNGVIENYLGIRKFLEGKGYEFFSSTDSEALVNLIAYHYAKEQNGTDRFFESVRKSLLHVEGTYGLGVLCLDEPGEIIGARKGSPLIVGLGDGESLLASDVAAFAHHTQNVVYLNDSEIVRLKAGGFSISTISQEDVEAVVQRVDWQVEESTLGDFSHYMEKEIFEQPTALENAMRGRLDEVNGTAKFGGLNLTASEFRQVDRILFCACGTAWHACLVAEYLIERFARIPVEVEYASEFRYRNAPLDKDTLVFVISQSGETIDTLAALREARRKGFRTLAITNVVGSTIARETDGGIYQYAGAEIGVASTKAFTSQILISAMVALYFGRLRDLSYQDGIVLIQALKNLPDQIRTILSEADHIQEIARKYADAEGFLFLGRQVMFPIALEGALKLKEISYIHAEGYPAAEMKHGPIALISETCPSLLFVNNDEMYHKTLSNLQEVRARKGRVIAVTTLDANFPNDLANDIITIPSAHEAVQPILASIPVQLLSYYIAKERNCDVDKPRNLAKSVTVE